MSKTLWRIRAIRQWNIIAKGMEVEIIVENRSGKPNIKEISQALERKYGIINLSGSGMPDSVFEYTKG